MIRGQDRKEGVTVEHVDNWISRALVHVISLGKTDVDMKRSTDNLRFNLEIVAADSWKVIERKNCVRFDGGNPSRRLTR